MKLLINFLVIFVITLSAICQVKLNGTTRIGSVSITNDDDGNTIIRNASNKLSVDTTKIYTKTKARSDWNNDITDSLAYATDTTALKLLNLGKGRYARLKSLSSGNSNGGGIFVVVDSAYKENGIIAFDHPANGKQFVRLEWLNNNSLPYASWTGAKKSNDFDASSYLRKALDINRTLFLDKGNYRILDTLLIQTDSRVVGVGNNYHSIINFDSDTAHIKLIGSDLVSKDNTRVKLEDFKIYYDDDVLEANRTGFMLDANASYMNEFHRISFGESSNFGYGNAVKISGSASVFRDCRFLLGDTAIYLHNALDVTIDNCQFERDLNGDVGSIVVLDTVGNTRIINSHFEESEVHFKNVSKVLFSGNYIYDVDIFVDYESNNNTFLNCDGSVLTVISDFGWGDRYVNVSARNIDVGVDEFTIAGSNSPLLPTNIATAYNSTYKYEWGDSAETILFAVLLKNEVNDTNTVKLRFLDKNNPTGTPLDSFTVTLDSSYRSSSEIEGASSLKSTYTYWTAVTVPSTSGDEGIYITVDNSDVAFDVWASKAINFNANMDSTAGWGVNPASSAYYSAANNCTPSYSSGQYYVTPNANQRWAIIHMGFLPEHKPYLVMLKGDWNGEEVNLSNGVYNNGAAGINTVISIGKEDQFYDTSQGDMQWMVIFPKVGENPIISIGGTGSSTPAAIPLDWCVVVPLE